MRFNDNVVNHAYKDPGRAPLLCDFIAMRLAIMALEHETSYSFYDYVYQILQLQSGEAEEPCREKCANYKDQFVKLVLHNAGKDFENDNLEQITFEEYFMK